MQIEPQEAYKGEAVTNLMLRLVIGQIKEGLQHEKFEHQYHIIWGPAALRKVGAPQGLLQSRAKAGPGDVMRETF